MTNHLSLETPGKRSPAYLLLHKTIQCAAYNSYPFSSNPLSGILALHIVSLQIDSKLNCKCCSKMIMYNRTNNPSTRKSYHREGEVWGEESCLCSKGSTAKGGLEPLKDSHGIREQGCT